MPAPISKVLIGGGTGFIGTHLSKVLKNLGYGVLTVSRMPGCDRISWHELDKKGLPQNTIAVVNLAGQNVMDFTRRWTSGFKQNVFNSRVNTTALLAKVINESPLPPKAFVTMSGVGGYKPDKSREYSEICPIEPFDFFSCLCIEWENASKLKPPVSNQCRVTIVRSGVVLGRDGGMIKQLYRPFSLGLGGPIGNGQQYLPWIHITDLVRLIIFAIEKPDVSGILNGVAPFPATNKEFSAAFGKALRRPAIIPTPAFVMNIMLGAERAKMVTEGQKVLPKRVQSLGFNYNYPDIEAACEGLVNSP